MRLGTLFAIDLATRFLGGIGSAGPAIALGATVFVALVWVGRLEEPGALALPTVPTARSVRAVLVLHPDDCPTNWRFLELLGSSALEGRIEIVRIAPPTSDGQRLRNRLPGGLAELPIVPLSGDDRRALGRLGYHQGPLLMLFDSRARLRSIEPAPSDPVEFVALGRRLRGALPGDRKIVPK